MRKPENSNTAHFAYENMLIYNEVSVVNDKVEEVAEAASITQEINNGNLFYGLKNGTYYIETPVEVITSHGNHDPLGYRMTECELLYEPGVAQAAVEKTIVHNENMFTISAELPINGDPTNEVMTYYLHPSGRFVRSQSGETTTKLWQMDNDGHIYHYQDGEYSYLEWSTSGWIRPTYSIKVSYASSIPSNASTFTIPQNSNHIRFGNNSSPHYVKAIWNSDLNAYKID